MTTSEATSSGGANAVLVGGPVDLPVASRQLRVEGDEQEIKVPHRNGYEHFVRDDAAVEATPVAYYWTGHTRIAE